MKCAYHPEVETNLRCSKCGTPICPKDMVQTPVGARCPDCAKLSKLPTYRVSREYYLRAAGAGLGMAIACGFAWMLLRGVVPFFLLNLLLAAGAGYAIGEVVSLSVNRKRGTGLVIVAALSVVISYLVTITVGDIFYNGLPMGLLNIICDLVAIALGVFVAITRLR